MSALTYREVGATRDGGPLPSGYHYLRHRTRIGRGRAVFEAAGAAISEWRMHRAAGVRLHADADRAAPGVRLRVMLGVGPLAVTAPCEVVWTIDEPGCAGFGYGTLAGHPESGEESFLVELTGDGDVWFSVLAFSRPGRWFTRAAGPLVPVLQKLFARRLGHTLARLAAQGPASGGAARLRE